MPMDAQKYGWGAGYKIIEHNIRYRNTNKDVKYGNPDIDKTRTKENYSLLDRKDPYKYLKNKIREYDELIPPKRIRDDRKILVGFNFTVPESIAGTPEERKYCLHCMDWMKKTFGEENIVSADVHRDEIHSYYDSHVQEWRTSRTHLQSTVIPFTPEKGVNCKTFMNRETLKRWHQELDKYIFEKMGIHDLQKADKNLCGRDMEELKRESIEAQAEIRDNLDKEIIEKTKDFNKLDRLYQTEMSNINTSIMDAEKHEKIAKQKADEAKAVYDKMEKRIDELDKKGRAMVNKINQLDSKYKEITEQVVEAAEHFRELADKYDLPAYNEIAEDIEQSWLNIER